MGLFRVGETTDEARKKAEMEVKEYTEEALEIGSQWVKSIPKFITEYQRTDDDDNGYILLATCTNDIVQRALDIQTMYYDFWKYIDAVEIYESYMEYLTEIFGDISIVENSEYSGISIAPLPNVPRMNKAKKMMSLYKAGFIPSRVDKSFKDETSFDASVDALPEMELDFSDMYSGKENKDLEKIKRKKEEKDRRRGLFAVTSNGMMQSTDAIIRSMMSSSESTEIDRFGNYVRKSMVDEAEEAYYEATHSEEDEEWDFVEGRDNHTIIENGRLVTKAAKRNQEVAKALMKIGVLDHTTMSGMLSKQEYAMMKKEYGLDDSADFENMTKKQKKKFLKKEIKRREAEAREVAGNRRLNEILSRNRITLTRGEMEGSSCTFADIFGSTMDDMD